MLSRATFASIRANALRINGQPWISRTTTKCPGAMHRLLPSRIMMRHKFDHAGPKPKGMDKLRQAYREHPILLPAGFAAVFISFIFLGYVNYMYFVSIFAFHNFPEPVAKELRKAIYFDKGVGKDPKKAFQHYKEAIMIATDLKMNPFSEEFMGMRIRMAEFLEEHNQYEAAITVLERERDYCYQFLDKAEEKGDVSEEYRSRIVGMAVKLGIKLGKLYSEDAVDDTEAAQEAFVLAVETLLKENIRRDQKGITDTGAKWLNSEEIGASLEELGHSYLKTKQPELALPLFLQALSLCPPKSCHAAMLMNQVSASLSMQKPGAAPLLKAPEKNLDMKMPTAKDLQNQARQWAEKALASAQALEPPERTEECDIACAVITHNLGELANMSGDVVTAKRLFQEAKTFSKTIGFEDGVKEASQALARLEGHKDMS
ncbi:uncharacterized protein PV09_01570 [Verruconis gallopava]|uniref:MalT-like TPR region domain-containing protein n=1 Tax=Verruconis gallopava TaxID=253628 RepID=A0A0D2ALI3_9PEZI|nr:uncharacterized protein PV09_01570 [Verruconis gallopava]KIW07623.1 hypothetical protein PV09_01570 [Verruconis gallopava]